MFAFNLLIDETDAVDFCEKIYSTQSVRHAFWIEKNLMAEIMVFSSFDATRRVSENEIEFDWMSKITV